MFMNVRLSRGAADVLVVPEEALLLKIYDSREDAQARLGAHTAFDDPCTPADAPPRQSIELRCLLFFDE